MNKIFLLLLFLLLSINSFSQELIALSIPLELKENANAVIRNSFTEVIINDVDEMVVKKKRVITVLNKEGDKEVDTYAHYDNDIKINKLSVKVYNAIGKEIKKYSKNKFLDISAVNGGTLYSDSRVKYIDYTPTKYPYTVSFESEYETSSTGYVPNWRPLESYYLSIEKSSYRITNPNNFIIRTKEKNFKNFPIDKISEVGVNYEMKNQPAIKYERNSFSFNELMPSLMVSLNKFKTSGISGYTEDWKSLGSWMYNSILNGRDYLNQKTISKAKELVKDAKSDIEKAKIIYQFVQDRTRYISVQVGIGGIQPISADEVDKMSYGDCKGLTNYTKALLNAVGVTSHYVHVEAGNSKISFDKDFASIEQGNHVILNIPNKGNDIWLECTSQTLPFGFLGDFTDDRDVLVITPEGGKIKRTPAYKNETNLQTTRAEIKLDSEGNIIADIERISGGTQYDNKFEIENKSKLDLEKYYKSSVWNYINNLEISAIEFKNNKDSITFTEKINASINNFASINQDEYIFRVNVFNKISYIPKRYRTRNLPLKINRGYKDVDEYIIKIPNNYSLQTLPAKKEIKSKFGIYTLSLSKKDEKTLLYKRSILIKDGLYPKEDYKLYRSFRKKIAKNENLRIALIKN